jgi:hypothetical protein
LFPVIRELINIVIIDEDVWHHDLWDSSHSASIFLAHVLLEFPAAISVLFVNLEPSLVRDLTTYSVSKNP